METGNEPPVPAEPNLPAGQDETTPARPDGWHRARTSNGKFFQTLESAERDAQAARLAGQGRKYQAIADELGYHGRGDAWRAVDRCRKAVLRTAGAELIASEAGQLDDLFVSAMEVLERDHLVVSHGKVVCGEDGQPLLDDGPKLAALREMRAIRESYRKLLGIDQPTQVAVSGSVKYEVVGVSEEDLR